MIILKSGFAEQKHFENRQLYNAHHACIIQLPIFEMRMFENCQDAVYACGEK